jgi:hypothetical protein
MHPRLQSVCSAFDTPPSPPGCPELVSTHKPCTSGPFAISTSRTSNWTNCEPGSLCATQVRLSLIGYRPLHPRFFPCLSSVPAPNTWLIESSIPCDRSWLPVASPFFTSDGLNLSFYALTAHFGTWREERRRGRKVRRWQVAAGLIYGQVKKCYRRRKLVHVTHVMRLGTEDADPRCFTGIGLHWEVEYRFY